jgi:hypothetical protein
MMDALGITRDLRADHPIRISLALRAINAANGFAIDDFDIQRTGGRTIMGADGGFSDDLVHVESLPSQSGLAKSWMRASPKGRSCHRR